MYIIHLRDHLHTRSLHSNAFRIKRVVSSFTVDFFRNSSSLIAGIPRFDRQELPNVGSYRDRKFARKPKSGRFRESRNSEEFLPNSSSTLFGPLQTERRMSSNTLIDDTSGLSAGDDSASLQGSAPNGWLMNAPLLYIPICLQ